MYVLFTSKSEGVKEQESNQMTVGSHGLVILFFKDGTYILAFFNSEYDKIPTNLFFHSSSEGVT